MRKLVTVFLCMVLSILQINAQNRTITGKITDTDGKPVAGASVLLKGTTKGVSADEKGAYSISIPTTTKTLVVTGIGFTTREMSVGAGNVVNVTLVSSDKNLEEVVVTGYSTKKKAEFTGATSRVSSKQIEQIPIASFEQILQGRAPGLYSIKLFIDL